MTNANCKGGWGKVFLTRHIVILKKMDSEEKTNNVSYRKTEI